MQAAMTAATSENGTIETWGNGSGTPGGGFTQYVVPQLRVMTTCGTGVNLGCFAPNTVYKYLNGNDDSPYDANPWCDKYRLADGAAILIGGWNQNCNSVRGTSLALSNSCGYFFVDINGDKKPNKQGYDSFYFWITKYGIVPFGAPDDTGHSLASCRKTGADSDGSCTAWVIYKENMDYLTCTAGADCDSKLKW